MKKTLGKVISRISFVLMLCSFIVSFTAFSSAARAKESEVVSGLKGIPGYSVYEGKNYSAVYDCEYYSTHYPELAEKFGYNGWLYIEHFVNEGMAAGLMGSPSFDVYSYKNAYPDLRKIYGNDLKKYYLHYLERGRKEGRDKTTGVTVEVNAPSTENTTNTTASPATDTYSGTDSFPADTSFNPQTPFVSFGTFVYNGIDLSSVYDYGYYTSTYPDLKKVFGNDENAAIKHFVKYGVVEGRKGRENTDWANYNFLKAISPNIERAPTFYMGVELSPVYCYEYYMWNNRDVAAAFKFDAAKAVEHFARFGFSEGRQGKQNYTAADYTRLSGEVKNIPNTRLAMAQKANGYSTTTGYLILVSKAAKQVEIYQGKQGGYASIKSIPCAIGAQRSPTPSGTYYVGSKGRFFNTGTRGRCWYYTQIKGNYLFHSQIYDRSSTPKNIIDGAMSSEVSHGCIRLYLDDAKWIYDNIPKGTTIVVY